MSEAGPRRRTAAGAPPSAAGTLRSVALVCLAVAAALLGAYAAARSAGLPLAALTRDPGSLARLPWHAGALSQLTVLLWASATTTLLLAARLAAGTGRRAALLLGLLALVLALDDALQLHEGAAGVLPGSDLTVVAVYALVAPAALLLVHRHSGGEVVVPLLAVACLAVSAAVDVLELGGAAAEDLPKTFAAALLALSGGRLLVREVRPAAAGDAADPA